MTNMTAKKFFFVLIGMLVLALLAIFGAFYWGNNQLEAEASDISTLIADRDIQQEKIIRLQQAKQDTTELESIETLLDRLLPPTKEQEQLVADVIFTATAEAGIPFSQVTSFSFSGSNEPNDLSGTTASKDNPGVFEYPFTLQIEEITYDTLLQLLREIETNGRIVQVDNIQIAPDAQNPNILSVSLSTKAYVRP